MKERSILFSSPMIRAILEGRKTQSRRVITCGMEMDGDESGAGLVPINPCPYGLPDDSLWIRETWQLLSKTIDADAMREHSYQIKETDQGIVTYRASNIDYRNHGWRPSIFMPRWASRIDLDIVQVRVERLQDISENDARAEGVEPDIDTIPFYGEYKDPFYRLWQSINAKRPGCTWDDNPWVWVIEFRQKGGDNGK